MRAILRERFDESLVRSILRSTIQTDRAGLETATELSEDLLAALRNREICAIRIPSYCSPALARKAGDWIRKRARVVNWYIPTGKAKVKTDMNYGIGLPVQIARAYPSAARKYVREAIPSIQKVRRAFAPSLSPMDRLRLELDEHWPAGANVAPFQGRNGFAGLVRIMEPRSLLGGVAGVHGVCHVDGGMSDRMFSANIYLEVPERGGELSIWNVALSRRNERSPVYSLIRNPEMVFDSEIQAVIHGKLPPPLKIKPRAGDLVILDTSRPHAVTGFDRGHRISIQTFLRFGEPADPISVFS